MYFLQTRLVALTLTETWFIGITFKQNSGVCAKALQNKIISEASWGSRAHWKLRKGGLCILSPWHFVSVRKVKDVLNFHLQSLFWQQSFWWRYYGLLFFLSSAEPKNLVLQFCRIPGHWLGSGAVLAHGILFLSWAFFVTAPKHGGTYSIL